MPLTPVPPHAGAFANFEFTLEGKNGGFTIRPSMEKTSTKVWIGRIGGDRAGEGGDFDAGMLLETLEKFFNENF